MASHSPPKFGTSEAVNGVGQISSRKSRHITLYLCGCPSSCHARHISSILSHVKLFSEFNLPQINLQINLQVTVAYPGIPLAALPALHAAMHASLHRRNPPPGSKPPVGSGSAGGGHSTGLGRGGRWGAG